MDISEGLDDWVEIQSSSPSNRALLYKDDTSVIIRDDFFSDSAVFPPSNHEGLPVANPDENQLSEKEKRYSSSSFTSSFSSDGDANGKHQHGEVKDISRSRITMGLGCLRCRIAAVASRMRNYAASKARIWLFTSATTGIGGLLFVFLLYFRVHRRRRQVKLLESKQPLMLLIKEKDQKISELLLQIAQLNDILLERKRVPVLRVS